MPAFAIGALINPKRGADDVRPLLGGLLCLIQSFAACITMDTRRMPLFRGQMPLLTSAAFIRNLVFNSFPLHKRQSVRFRIKYGKRLSCSFTFTGHVVVPCFSSFSGFLGMRGNPRLVWGAGKFAGNPRFALSTFQHPCLRCAT